MDVPRDQFDVVVVGAGHAGCEAALAAARLGCRTLILSVSLDNVAFMACNPSIGGPGKGHLVREVDALGGEMGRAIDRTQLQMRMLNTSKGRAVRALRAQADKRLYHQIMKSVLEAEERLSIREGTVVDLIVANGAVNGVKMRGGDTIRSRVVILATGTFLGGVIHIGDIHYASGPAGFPAATQLSSALEAWGIGLKRFKTGTSPRINGRTVQTGAMQKVEGDPDPGSFSFWYDPPVRPRRCCWLTHTTPVTSEIIRRNLERSALFGGHIHGAGPRYCPSIESKIVEFPSRDSHPIFVEPESEIGEEMYLSGLSTSLPLEVQWKIIGSIPGLENADIMRPGYAIEYDVIDSTRLKPGLEDREIAGLFCAGQLNGTSGYEEAAAQGLIAGINAAMLISGNEPVIIERWRGYIGVLIDDLTVKGTTDPYRMLTARAEHRLLLREGNADMRLADIGFQCGLLTTWMYDRFVGRKQQIANLKERLESDSIEPSPEAERIFRQIGTTVPAVKTRMADLLRRPEVTFNVLAALKPDLAAVPPAVARQVEDEIKYSGYITREQMHVERRARHESRRIPKDFDFSGARGLSREAREKLVARHPSTLGEASRIPGVSPSDVAVLELLLASGGGGCPLPDQPEGGVNNG